MTQHSVVGVSAPRIDAYDKVTGRAVYVGDMKFPHMLQGKVLRSPYAHALVKRIDTSKALALPGVRCVLTSKDVPDIPFTLCGHPLPFDTPLDARIFATHVRYVGDPVAAVAAETREIAEKALGLIEVEYEELPFYLTPQEALAEGAMEIHEGSGNLCGETDLAFGDVDQALKDADYVVEDEYDSPIVTHAQIEPHVSIVIPDPKDGRLTVYASTQCPSIMRERLAYILGLDRRKIHLIKMTVGGGFGGKQEPVYEQINCVLAQACGCPVMLELTREENLACTRTRHTTHYKIRTGVNKDGTIVAREIDIEQNTGAYASHGHNVFFNQFGQFDSLYPCPNMRVRGRTVYTNILIAAAMRGYGIPQYCIANESHLDHVAQVIGMDPLTLRQKNLYQLGQERKYAPPHSVGSCGLPQVIEEGRRRIGYDEFRKAPPQDEGPIKYGIGVALSSYNSCVYSHSVELSAARILVQDDASATLFLGCTEIGQGADTAMAQIAAETLGIPLDWVTVKEGDTDLCPFDAGAYASRQTYVTGNAVKQAALKCKAQMLDRAAKLLERPAAELDTRLGKVIDKATGEEIGDLRKVAEDMVYHLTEGNTCCHEVGYIPTTNALNYAATFAIVGVDTETGQYEVKKLVTCMDCGTLINPQAAMGQLTGGTIMCFGFGTMEQILIDPKTGRVHNDTLLDYKIPTFADLPPIDAHFIETVEPSSAYGNKSLGEPPNVTPAAAIHNAVCNALGIQIPSNPLTPERVYLAIAENKKKQGGV